MTDLDHLDRAIARLVARFERSRRRTRLLGWLAAAGWSAFVLAQLWPRALH